ncbi:MAG: hypothetical protein L3J62_06740 [Gammaproteobacteria bacterium]|nr:hypothetical protein [Gammaproteobacteria bacterium]MCF6230473.1 hypothetical protein [Gammaproteobacteria bacterium]
MKKTVSIIAISCLVLLAGCSEQAEETTADPATQPPTQQAAPATPAPAHPPMGDHSGHSADHPAMPGHTPSQAAPAHQYQAEVISVTHAAGYTYMEIEFNGKNTWIAASPVNVKTGDTIAWAGGAPMSNFTSKSLRKTFDEIIFVDQVSVVE